MKVLIAHADPATRRTLRHVLEGERYDVREAGDADELDAECEYSPDVTLLDAQLSRTAGVSLVTRIKAHRYAYFTSIVLIDRDIDSEGAKAQLDAGAYDFLIEPLRTGEVIARVKAAARTRSLQEELLVQGRRLETLIFEDPLTQLYNRRFMLAQLASLVSGARRHRRPLSIVMIDVDHFKALNDSFGHDFGDQVLATVARAMRERLRAEDYLGRLGGEEFLALLPDADAAAAAEVANALRATVAAINPIAGDDKVQITVSAGHATWGGEAPEELLKRADDAMYRAKASGRDTVESG